MRLSVLKAAHEILLALRTGNSGLSSLSSLLSLFFGERPLRRANQYFYTPPWAEISVDSHLAGW